MMTNCFGRNTIQSLNVCNSESYENEAKDAHYFVNLYEKLQSEREKKRGKCRAGILEIGV